MSNKPLQGKDSANLRLTYDNDTKAYKDQFVHEENRAMARLIIQNWIDAKMAGDAYTPTESSRYAVLYSPMQSGKTGVMQHIMFLLNVAEDNTFAEQLGKNNRLID